MRTKESFKYIMDVDVAIAQTEIARFRVRGTALTGETKEKHDAHVAKLEQKLDATKARLRELGKAEEHVWENLKDDVKHTWIVLQSALLNAISDSKVQPRLSYIKRTKVTIPYGLELKSIRLKNPKEEVGQG